MSDYPKMLFRTGGDMEEHKIGGEPLLIQGKYTCDTLIVEDAQEEADALADGWGVSPDPDVQSAAQTIAAQLSEKDDEIAALRAQLAKFDGDGDGMPGGSKPRRGRPPKDDVEQQDAEMVEPVTEGQADGE